MLIFSIKEPSILTKSISRSVNKLKLEYPAPKSSTPTIQSNFLISAMNFDTSLKSEISSDSNISNSKNFVYSLFLEVYILEWIYRKLISKQ